jgi:CCR4-NOT transcription complex subunit 9
MNSNTKEPSVLLPSSSSSNSSNSSNSSSGNAGGSGMVSNAAPAAASNGDSSREIYISVQQLLVADQRENALAELSKKRESFADLASILWYTYGTIAALIQEIVSIYPMLSPPNLTASASSRVCNALALLQCVASHSETKMKLMHSYIPLYLFPFLNTVSKHRPFEYLR